MPESSGSFSSGPSLSTADAVAPGMLPECWPWWVLSGRWDHGSLGDVKGQEAGFRIQFLLNSQALSHSTLSFAYLESNMDETVGHGQTEPIIRQGLGPLPEGNQGPQGHRWGLSLLPAGE